jgi:hypothetical protein
MNGMKVRLVPYFSCFDLSVSPAMPHRLLKHTNTNTQILTHSLTLSSYLFTILLNVGRNPFQMRLLYRIFGALYLKRCWCICTRNSSRMSSLSRWRWSCYKLPINTGTVFFFFFCCEQELAHVSLIPLSKLATLETNVRTAGTQFWAGLRERLSDSEHCSSPYVLDSQARLHQLHRQQLSLCSQGQFRCFFIGFVLQVYLKSNRRHHTLH